MMITTKYSSRRQALNDDSVDVQEPSLDIRFCVSGWRFWARVGFLVRVKIINTTAAVVAGF